MLSPVSETQKALENPFYEAEGSSRLSSQGFEIHEHDLHNTLLFLLDENFAAPVVLHRRGRERGQHGPEEP